MMLEELERRNYTDATIRHYLRFVEEFAQHFGKSPDKLGVDHCAATRPICSSDASSRPGSVENRISALRFFFVRTLHRHEFREFLPYPKVRRKLPNILSKEEVDAADQRQQRPVQAHAADGSLRHRHAPHRRSSD